VDFVHGRGEGLEGSEGGGVVHLAVGAEGGDFVGGSAFWGVVAVGVVEGHFD